MKNIINENTVNGNNIITENTTEIERVMISEDGVEIVKMAKAS